MTTLIIVLLVLWAVFAVIGFVVEGLLWLAFIGLVLLAATAAWGWIKRRTNRS
ncbi:MAG: LPXTG cell wall anchor domain-containing protein [Microcella sp.]|uniref:LPXTG cell wall anchor domain-containing protein n=1 Tax=Microcella sp. TaxID=1913979 RepID=UPI002725A98C|nr:LPXTG cell wall anchor domain-containing protein [Microcella sp.]MDO8337714.1 LPXTG cell wall anchor domain-containing protein [Microcella sp.]